MAQGIKVDRQGRVVRKADAYLFGFVRSFAKLHNLPGAKGWQAHSLDTQEEAVFATRTQGVEWLLAQYATRDLCMLET